MSSRGGNTHWCYQCQQPVRPLGDSMLCPRCDGGFVQELDELGGGVGVGAGGGSYGYRDSHGPDDLLGIMDALESLMLRNSPEHRLRLMEALMSQRRRHGVDSDPRSYNPEHALALLEPLDVLRRQRRRRYGSDSEHPGSPWLIFQGQMPSRASRSPSAGGLEMILNGSPGVGFTRGSSDDYFVGPGLQELVEELMERLVTDRQGPPPAPRSAIDAMPTIKITRAHLQTDSHCPVCKDRFELGTEVRQMPCNHIYHSDCIVPWLVQHNSCPVCRHVMGSAPPSRGKARPVAGSGVVRAMQEERQKAVTRHTGGGILSLSCGLFGRQAPTPTPPGNMPGQVAAALLFRQQQQQQQQHQQQRQRQQ